MGALVVYIAVFQTRGAQEGPPTSSLRFPKPAEAQDRESQ